MKNLSLAAVFALLFVACPMTGTPPAPATPNGAKGPAQGECLCAEELAANGPEVKEWANELPEPSLKNGGWVIESIDEQNSQFLLTLIDVDHKAVAVSFLLKDPEQKLEALNKIAEQQMRRPNILHAVITGVRPLPQPGPPGHPDDFYFRGFNAMKALVWARQLSRQDFGR